MAAYAGSCFRGGDESESQTTGNAMATPQRKKRNQSKIQNPDAEVIALSPKTLMAANRFICEVCNKGFQREQNLQLHRRGHNLPWKLKQKTKAEVKRKIYLCPEPSCIHHDPARALGDLTGVKKHYFRKHGEKKYKCDKCSKKYAVQSDWKAHSKICGTREYRCDCGTLFSRRDSFITHRAFCDALAKETSIPPISLNSLGVSLYGNNHLNLGPSSQNVSSILPAQNPSSNMLQVGDFPPSNPYLSAESISQRKSHHGSMQYVDFYGKSLSNMVNFANLGFFSRNCASTMANTDANSSFINPQHHLYTPHGGNQGMNIISGSVEDHVVPEANISISSYVGNQFQQQPSMIPHTSATALLQKAAQMFSTAGTNTSALIRSLGNSNGNCSEINHMISRNVGMQMERDGQIQGMMNSFPPVFGGDKKMQRALKAEAEENKMTLDFLGVDGMVSNFCGGLYQNEKQGAASTDA